MTAAYVLTLSAEQTQELERVQATHPQAHFRVKATALLKVAAGDSIEQVRLHGLLTPVNWATLKRWIDRYQQEGIKGWKVKPGRGRRPAFSPYRPNAAASPTRGGRGAAPRPAFAGA